MLRDQAPAFTGRGRGRSHQIPSHDRSHPAGSSRRPHVPCACLPYSTADVIQPAKPYTSTLLAPLRSWGASSAMPTASCPGPVWWLRGRWWPLSPCAVRICQVVQGALPKARPGQPCCCHECGGQTTHTQDGPSASTLAERSRAGFNSSDLSRLAFHLRCRKTPLAPPARARACQSQRHAFMVPSLSVQAAPGHVLPGRRQASRRVRCDVAHLPSSRPAAAAAEQTRQWASEMHVGHALDVVS